ETWSVSSTAANLQTGPNRVRLTSMGSGGPNMDHLTIEITGCQPGYLEAEDAVLSGPIVASLHPGFTSRGYADYQNPSGDYIEWNVNTAAAGPYLLQFKYANGRAADRRLK